MSPVIRIGSFPEVNRPKIAEVIAEYTGVDAAEELLRNLPFEFTVEAHSLEDVKSRLEQLGCKLDFVRDTDAEHVLSGDDDQDEFLGLLTKLTPRLFVTPILLALNIVVFGVMVLSGVSLFTPKIEELLLWGANFAPLTVNQEWWRLFSSTFLHIGFLHLAFNMWVLWDLGRLAERMFGNWPFLMLYVLSGLGGSIASLWWNPTIVSAGASGAIFGIAGGLIMFLYLWKIALPRPVIKRNLTSVLSFTTYNLFYGFTKSGIDNAGHLGGFFVGLVIGAFLHRRLPAPQPYTRPRYYLGPSAVALSLIVAAGFAKMQIINDPFVKSVAAGKLLYAGKVDEAIVELQKALELKPEFGDAHNGLGVAYSRKGLYDDALASFKKALELKPNDAEVHNNLGAAYLKKGLYDEATVPLKKALELKPDYAFALNNLGFAYLRKGLYDEAMVPLKKALELKPDYAVAHENLGTAYFFKGLYDDAIASLKKALALTSEDPEVHNNLGAAYLKKGLYDEALAPLKKAVALKPDYALAHNNLGLTYGRKGLHDEAITSFKKTLDLTPGDPEVHNNLGFAYLRKGLYDEATVPLKKALELKPDYAVAHKNLGAAHFFKGLYDDAIASLKKALALTSEDPEVHNNLGAAYLEKGLYDDAIASLKKAVALNPGDPEVHNNLGFAYLRKGLYNEAITSFKKALELKPDYAFALNNLGFAYLRKGLYDEALAAFKKALEIKPDYVEALKGLGNAYRQKGLYAEAIGPYKKVLEINPDNAENHEALGSAFLWKGDHDQAMKEYREALRLQPGSAGVHYHIAFVHFLEGRFEHAIKEIEEGFGLEPEGDIKLYRMLWQNLSLKHIGRHGDAQKLLEDFGKHFKAEGWESYVLHYHQGQLTESELISKAKGAGDQCEAYFYIGYQYLLGGDKQKARAYFQKAVDTRAFGDFEYIGARARLAQLGAN